jgi:hypothetical protein
LSCAAVLLLWCVVVHKGIIGCMAFRPYLSGPATNACDAYSVADEGKCAQSLMQILTDPNHAPARWKSGPLNLILQLSVDLFPPVAILSSIPVFSIVIKYNVIENGFSKTAGFIWGVLFPWVAALPLLYQPNALNQFITFSSLVRVYIQLLQLSCCLSHTTVPFSPSIAHTRCITVISSLLSSLASCRR